MFCIETYTVIRFVVDSYTHSLPFISCTSVFLFLGDNRWLSLPLYRSFNKYKDQPISKTLNKDKNIYYFYRE
jgi:hypothetical protein